MQKEVNEMRPVSIHDSETLRAHGLCVTPGTLRIWKHYGRYVDEGLFIKIGNRLYVDLDTWQEILKKEQRKMMEVGKRMQARSFKRKEKTKF